MSSGNRVRTVSLAGFVVWAGAASRAKRVCREKRRTGADQRPDPGTELGTADRPRRSGEPRVAATCSALVIGRCSDRRQFLSVGPSTRPTPCARVSKAR